MPLSRRDLGLLLPALTAASAGAQEGQAKSLAPSRVHHNDQIPYQGDQKKKGRRFFYGATHGGFNLEMHETILGAGMETHPPHKHEHEEVVIVTEGTVEATIDGKAEVAEAGSVIYFGSNTMHNARNIGKTPSRYYVLELRGNEA